MATYEELMQSAEQIRTNELPESNTHELVGQLLKNMIAYFEVQTPFQSLELKSTKDVNI